VQAGTYLDFKLLPLAILGCQLSTVSPYNSKQTTIVQTQSGVGLTELFIHFIGKLSK